MELVATQATSLVPIEEDAIKAIAPWWPYSRKATYKLIRDGRLRVVKISRRYFLTAELLREFVDEHTVRLRARHDELAARAAAFSPAETTTKP